MVRWADPERIAAAVRSYADGLRARRPSVRRVLWYGSWVSGIPTATSDVDLVIVVEHDARRPRDRLPDFLPDRFPVGVDLVVLTERELGDLAERSPGWYRAVKAGRAM